MARSNEQALADLVGVRFPVLDKGHVILLDVMGSDESIVEDARQSYGKGTKRVSDDETLIRYLMRHKELGPFEQAEIKLNVRVPMDTWRQWSRYRTASIQEYSTRYSEAIEDKQETPPDQWRLQSKDNKQGSGGFLEDWPDLRTKNDCEEGHASPGAYLSFVEQCHHQGAKEVYEERLKFGVAREQARKDLPLSTFTQAIWKCDLRNTLWFLFQRLDSHAQWEIRQYAMVIGELVEKLFPITWRAFTDYVLESITLTKLDIYALRSAGITFFNPANKWDSCLDFVFSNKRERQECLDKLKRIGFVVD